MRARIFTHTGERNLYLATVLDVRGNSPEGMAASAFPDAVEGDIVYVCDYYLKKTPAGWDVLSPHASEVKGLYLLATAAEQRRVQ